TRDCRSDALLHWEAIVKHPSLDVLASSAVACLLAACDKTPAVAPPSKQPPSAASPSGSPTAPAATATVEQELAKGFVDFTGRFVKLMNEKYYAGDTWIVKSADVERTQ